MAPIVLPPGGPPKVASERRASGQYVVRVFELRPGTSDDEDVVEPVCVAGPGWRLIAVSILALLTITVQSTRRP